MDKKRIAVLSSCRLGGLVQDSYIHEIHHTHNTREAMQYIRFITGKIDIERDMHRYVFRSCYLDNDNIVDRDRLKSEWETVDTVCIELCSRKKYTKNGYAIHHLAADKGDAPGSKGIEENKSNEEFELEIQERDEIEADILKLVDLISPKRVAFVTHIDHGIIKRAALIDQIMDICAEHNIPAVNPSAYLDTLKAEMDDPNHFTAKGSEMMADLILQKIAESSTARAAEI